MTTSSGVVLFWSFWCHCSTKVPLASFKSWRCMIRRISSRTCLPSPDAGQPLGEPLLGATEFAGLGVVAPLPVELARGAVAQPGEQQRQRLLVVLYPFQQVVTEVEAVHQGPGAGPLFGTDNLVG